MKTTKYKAVIHKYMYEDDFSEGEGEQVGTWDEEYTKLNKADLRDDISSTTHTEWESIDDEQMNGYDWCTEYHTSYLSDKDGMQASEGEIEKWRQGEMKLYSVQCHILVTKIVESKVKL